MVAGSCDADEQGAAQAGARLAPRVTLDVDPVGPSAFNLSFKPINLVVMHCPDCGKAISEQDRVCPNCGADLEAPLGEKELQTLAEVHLERAQNSYDQGRDFKSALAECDLALEFTPDSARAHNLRGLILDAQEKTALAVREYQEALRLDPALTEARDNLMDAEADLRKFKEEAGSI